MNISIIVWNQVLDAIKTNKYTEQHLDLWGLDLEAHNVQELVLALASNRYITSLTIGSNKLGDIGVSILADNKTLRNLDVRYNEMGDAGAIALADNKTLTSLEVNHNKMGDAGAIALGGNKTLNSLNVSYNKIGNAGAIALSSHIRLSRLYISKNQVGDAGAIALASNDTLSNLDLSFNQIGDAGAIALTNNDTLSNLDLSFNQIGDAGAIALAGNKVLYSLKLGHNQIGDAGGIALASNKRLKDLEVSSNKIREAGAIALGANDTLESLAIAGSYLSEAAVRALANNNTLTSLDISFNHLRPAQAAILAENRTLTSLNMCHNWIKDSGAIALANHEKLINLNVRGTLIGDEGCLALGRNTILRHLDIRENHYEITNDGLVAAFESNHTLISLDSTNSLLSEKLQKLDLAVVREKGDTTAYMTLEERSAVIRERILGPYEQRMKSIEAFLMGTHKRAGANSSVQALLDPNLFDPALLTMIFSFLGHAPPPKRVIVKPSFTPTEIKRALSSEDKEQIETLKSLKDTIKRIPLFLRPKEAKMLDDVNGNQATFTVLKNAKKSIERMASRLSKAQTLSFGIGILSLAFIMLTLLTGLSCVIPMVLAGSSLTLYSGFYLFDRQTRLSSTANKTKTLSDSFLQQGPPQQIVPQPSDIRPSTVSLSFGDVDKPVSLKRLSF